MRALKAHPRVFFEKFPFHQPIRTIPLFFAPRKQEDCALLLINHE